MPEATPQELAAAAERLQAFLVIVFVAHWKRLQDERADSPSQHADGTVQKLAPARDMNAYYAYIRVSTVKQGEKGSSLQEQRDSIERFAARSGFKITQWFEERETAAKRGRSEFLRMMSALEKGKATGVILHKIDRGARNLWDWARIQDLVERGVDVHFAHESVDLKSRGGRLSADIQAVVAADYIRNLRDEVTKGIVGRLKQGFCPWGAPVGYLNRGKATAKAIDPNKGPLVAMAFELYATGSYTIETLRKELWNRGLRSRKERTLGRSQVGAMLRNPFYIGLIKHRSTGQVYQGVHQPLISKALFDRVQDVIEGRGTAKIVQHEFLYRRLVRCSVCHKALTGERQRGHVYYRCHAKGCPTNAIREEWIVQAIDRSLKGLTLKPKQLQQCEPMLVDAEGRFQRAAVARKANAQLKLEATEKRLKRLMDAFLDGAIERDAFQQTNTSLPNERADLRDVLTREENELTALREAMRKCKDLLTMLPLSTAALDNDGLRSTLKVLSSNIVATGKNVVVELRDPFARLGAALNAMRCGRHCARVRTMPSRNPEEVLSGALLLDLQEALQYWEPRTEKRKDPPKSTSAPKRESEEGRRARWAR